MKMFTTVVLLLISSATFALCNKCCKDQCDSKNFHYCDSSAGRYINKNGDFSPCFCTKRAVMALQGADGCCLWQGGVLKVAPNGTVICNNGVISETCTRQNALNQSSFTSF